MYDIRICKLHTLEDDQVEEMCVSVKSEGQFSKFNQLEYEEC